MQLDVKVSPPAIAYNIIKLLLTYYRFIKWCINAPSWGGLDRQRCITAHREYA